MAPKWSGCRRTQLNNGTICKAAQLQSRTPHPLHIPAQPDPTPGVPPTSQIWDPRFLRTYDFARWAQMFRPRCRLTLVRLKQPSATTACATQTLGRNLFG